MCVIQFNNSNDEGTARNKNVLSNKTIFRDTFPLKITCIKWNLYSTEAYFGDVSGQISVVTIGDFLVSKFIPLILHFRDTGPNKFVTVKRFMQTLHRKLIKVCILFGKLRGYMTSNLHRYGRGCNRFAYPGKIKKKTIKSLPD